MAMLIKLTYEKNINFNRNIPLKRMTYEETILLYLKMSPGKALETLPSIVAFKSTAIFISSAGYLD